MYSVYFLESIKSGKVYVGFTEKDPAFRLKEHNAGTNQWTKQNRPFKILYYERYLCKADAQSREKFYKSGVGRGIKKSILLYLRKQKLDW